jgi:hypothetical protein
MIHVPIAALAGPAADAIAAPMVSWIFLPAPASVPGLTIGIQTV